MGYERIRYVQTIGNITVSIEKQRKKEKEITAMFKAENPTALVKGRTPLK